MILNEYAITKFLVELLQLSSVDILLAEWEHYQVINPINVTLNIYLIYS